MTALWTFDDLVAASGGSGDGATGRNISGISIDTRSLNSGDLFVALKDQRDGHEFVSTAFEKGAAAALVEDSYVRKPGDGALVRVSHVLHGLENIAKAARAQLAPSARVIAVTGSVGKTGTKEMLKACLSRVAPGAVHAAEKSFNNHWGVPLTLASMPASTKYGVFEIGMNHAGEITSLTKFVRPHVAIITTVEAVHIENFDSVEGIAEAKSEIFLGLEPGGVAVMNFDNPHFALMRQRARDQGAHVQSFGLEDGADIRPSKFDLSPDGTDIEVNLPGGRVAYRLAAPGSHIAMNSLAVAAAIDAVGADAQTALSTLGELAAPKGRGSRTVLDVPGGQILIIDESYNANPASMRSALAAMATVPRSRFARRVAVLGDMLELGPESSALHAGLADAVIESGVDVAYTSGPQMAHLHAAIAPKIHSVWALAARELQDALIKGIRAGDVIMIKGSNGSRMGPLVEALKEKFAGPAANA